MFFGLGCPVFPARNYGASQQYYIKSGNSEHINRKMSPEQCERAQANIVIKVFFSIDNLSTVVQNSVKIPKVKSEKMLAFRPMKHYFWAHLKLPRT